MLSSNASTAPTEPKCSTIGYLHRLMKCGKSRISGYKAITKNDPMTHWEACPRLCFESNYSQGRILLLNCLLDGDAYSFTPIRSPESNGMVEAFVKTILQEFYQVAFRRKIYRSIEELQIDLDDWLHHYNHDRTYQGKMCCGRTPMQTLIDGKEVWNDKITLLNN